MLHKAYPHKIHIDHLDQNARPWLAWGAVWPCWRVGGAVESQECPGNLETLKPGKPLEAFKP